MRLLLPILALLLAPLGSCSDSGLATCIVGGDQQGNLKVLLGTGECPSNICVSYLTPGPEGYCSNECNDNGGCPGGFICCPVLQTGPVNACTSNDQCTERQSCRNNQ